VIPPPQQSAIPESRNLNPPRHPRQNPRMPESRNFATRRNPGRLTRRVASQHDACARCPGVLERVWVCRRTGGGRADGMKIARGSRPSSDGQSGARQVEPGTGLPSRSSRCRRGHELSSPWKRCRTGGRRGQPFLAHGIRLSHFGLVEVVSGCGTRYVDPKSVATCRIAVVPRPPVMRSVDASVIRTGAFSW
jgi:hypothetical protein